MTCPEYEKQLQHLIEMARIPGFKDHAWHQAKRLDAHPSGLYAGIKAELTRVMVTESGHRTPKKPR